MDNEDQNQDEDQDQQSGAQPQRKQNKGAIDYVNSAYKTSKHIQGAVKSVQKFIPFRRPPVPSLGAPGAPGGTTPGVDEAVGFFSKYKYLVCGGIFLLIVVIVLLFDGGGINGGLGSSDSTNTTQQPGGRTKTTGGGLCPSTSDNFSAASCKYLDPAIDLFATDLSQESINKYLDRYGSVFVNSGIGDKDEFTRRVNYIIDSSKQAGLNPALFLGYWKSESLFGTKSSRQMGCTGATFEEQVDCAVGINRGSDPKLYPIPNCARSKDANSVACQTLKGIRTANSGQDDTYPVDYPISTFDDYAEAYGPFSHVTAESPKGNCTSTYNILIEVAKELGACSAKPTGSAPLGSVPSVPSDIRQGIIDNFGITMNGFDSQHLKWAWDVLWELSNTNFPSLVKGVTVRASDGGSSQVGCAGAPVAVNLGQYTPEAFFKFIFTHELGHVIQSCLPRSKSHFNEAINAYNTEGGISYYGKNASSCNGTVNVNENYADIIAYYLHPQAGLGSGPKSCGGPTNPPNPFFSGSTSFPLHYSVGEDVLKSGQDI